jgi:hypothetical protein
MRIDHHKSGWNKRVKAQSAVGSKHPWMAVYTTFKKCQFLYWTLIFLKFISHRYYNFATRYSIHTRSTLLIFNLQVAFSPKLFTVRVHEWRSRMPHCVRCGHFPSYITTIWIRKDGLMRWIFVSWKNRNWTPRSRTVIILFTLIQCALTVTVGYLGMVRVSV